MIDEADVEADLATWLGRSLGRGTSTTPPRADIEHLAAQLTETVYTAGTLVYERHQLPERVHFLRSGTVELARDLGGRLVVVQLLSPGAVFGDVPVFLRTGETNDARATVDSTVLAVDSLTLFSILGQRPALARCWLVSMAGRLAEMHERVGDLLAGSLDRQVGSWLLREAGEHGAHVSQQTLARLLGARRTSVNQSLRRLEDEGLIQTGYRRVSVVDVDGLRSTLGLD